MSSTTPAAHGVVAGDLPSQVLLAQSRILQRISQGDELEEGLQTFCKAIEEIFAASACSVSLVDHDRQILRIAAAPSLPKQVVEALQDLTIGLAPGSCSAAAYGNETIVSSCIDEDSTWDGMKSEMLAGGLEACWSTPIRGLRWAESLMESADMLVLGTVAVYFEERRSPSDDELRALELAGGLAGVAVNTARARESIGRVQLYDPVTELPNRKIFTQHLKHVVRDMTPKNDKLGILLIDLDHFKEVNDTFGYAVGDFLLRSVAERLVELRKDTDLLSRFGDDEFGFLISDIDSSDEVKTIAAKALEIASEPYDFGGQKLGVSASIGGSIYPWDGEDAQTLLRNAENALYSAKKEGRGHYRLYAPTMGGYAFEKLQLKMALSHAVSNQELSLGYQPKVDARSNRVVGVEALCYWDHPGFGRISPVKFIPLAEETGLIIQIGEWVLRTACEQLSRWRSRGFEIGMAVNISAIQFRERNFVDSIGKILHQTRVSPVQLEIELTESVAMHEVDRTMERMKELQQLGVRIAIDDFGTGYSSLAYLKRFPIHTLKIDKSFVLKTPHDQEDQAIVRAVVALARHLNLEVVAEGVETAEQARSLREEGCQYLQGYHFSRPVPAQQAERFFHTGFPSG